MPRPLAIKAMELRSMPHSCKMTTPPNKIRVYLDRMAIASWAATLMPVILKKRDLNRLVTALAAITTPSNTTSSSSRSNKEYS